MTTPKMEKIGLLADMSEQGDWAFETSLRMAREMGAQLNIFHFMESPYEVPQDVAPSEIAERQYDDAALVQADRKIREYYDEKLGDYVDVGFRVCESVRHNLELRRCLKRKDFQLIFIPYPARGVTFGNMGIEEFAFRFTAPMVLVGPERAGQLHLNPPANNMNKYFGSLSGDLSVIPEPAELQNRSVI